MKTNMFSNLFCFVSLFLFMFGEKIGMTIEECIYVILLSIYFCIGDQK